MKQILNVYKPKGLTPLEVVKLVRQKFPQYKDEKIGYAGRLDPLAHGVLLLMVGEETTKEKDKYLNLSKEYEFEAVFGVSTDTYDVLGLALSSRATERSRGISFTNGSKMKRSLHSSADSVGMTQIKQFIKSKLGKQVQIYPPYSSKTVDGKPLHWWAKNNKLSEIKIPTREIEIHDFKLIKLNTISVEEFKNEIFKQIDSVTGDFRQKEIKEKWEKFFANYCHPEFISGSPKQKMLKQVQHDKINEFQTARFKISCTSGTYVRSLINQLGEKLGSGSIALEILRTKAGAYVLKNSIKLT